MRMSCGPGLTIETQRSKIRTAPPAHAACFDKILVTHTQNTTKKLPSQQTCTLFNVRRTETHESEYFTMWSPFYRDLSVCSSHGRGVLTGKLEGLGNQARHRGKWKYKTYNLLWYFTPFHSFKDLKNFVAEILKSWEIFIFIGRNGRGSQNWEYHRYVESLWVNTFHY
jgi:hypothetical protein